jgi:short-subunit dehydrogenase
MSQAFREKYGPFALIAGASVGLGAEFAAQLAARGLNLLLLARRAEVLAPLAARLSASSGVEVRTAAIDLAAGDLLARVREAAGDLEIGLLVYNAAFSLIGPFLDQPLVDHLRILDVNCRGPLILAHELGRAMVARGRGGIVLMSSMAGAQGSPQLATYSASKAFDLVLAEALWGELEARGVDVIACRAGATRTPNFEQSMPQGGPRPMEPGPVVRATLDALGRGPSVVPGALNRAAALLFDRALPRALSIRVMHQAVRRMYGR